MKILLILLCLSILFWGFSIPWLIREYARRSADQIIQGKRPAAVKHISRCISVLSWSNNWITARTEPDNQRIDRLIVKLDEMQHPHG